MRSWRVWWSVLTWWRGERGVFCAHVLFVCFLFVFFEETSFFCVCLCSLLFFGDVTSLNTFNLFVMMIL